MRKVLFSLAAASSALAFTTPAAAQYVPAPQPGYGYGNGYNTYGQVRALQARIDGIERQINRLDRRDVIRDRNADRLRSEANTIEHRLHAAARYGLNPYEANDIERRIAGLEQRVRYAVANNSGRYNGYGYGGYGYNGYNNGGFYDADRDGRDDRWEREHDRDHDGDRDD